MSVDKETEIKYNQIIGTLMQNVIAQYGAADHKIVLWDFQEDQPYDRLYFNFAAIVADWRKKLIYIQMPFFAYLKFKWHRRKTRKNLRWCGPLMARKLSDNARTSVYLIMSFVAEYYDIDMEVFKAIQEEFYS